MPAAASLRRDLAGTTRCYLSRDSGCLQVFAPSATMVSSIQHIAMRNRIPDRIGSAGQLSAMVGDVEHGLG